jgi:DNA-binding transcriptional MerR regulator
MRIGDLAQATGTPVETIRFYEREGLLPPARRADNNYRVYEHAHAERLALIRHCRGLDMTLEEVRTLLRLRERPAADCAEVNALLDAHLRHEPGRCFVDEMTRGIYRTFRHTHCFEPSEGGTRLTDTVEFSLGLGRWVDNSIGRMTLERTFRRRHRALVARFGGRSHAG